MKNQFSVALLCLLASSITTAADTHGQLIAVTLSKPGTLQVVSHRMEPLGAGAAMGGLVGIAIQGSIQSSKDEDMKKRLLEAYPEAACGQPVLDAFMSRLQADGSLAIESAPGKHSTVVDISIDECGLHLTDQLLEEYGAYVYMTLKFNPGGAGAWTEKIQVSGRNRYGFSEFIQQSGLAQNELEDVLKRAGVRAADKIIWKK